MVIDREVLKVAEVYQCSAPGWSRGLPFSDGINIGHISPDREVKPSCVLVLNWFRFSFCSGL